MLSEKKIKQTKGGIAAYVRQQKLLLYIIKRNGSITEQQFDKIFATYKRKEVDGRMRVFRSKPRFLQYMAPNTFFLGSLNQPGDWAKWLDLAQKMAAIGLIEMTGKKDNVVYSLP